MSSWLGRTARFYGLSLVGLFAEHVGSPRPHDAISAVDLGDPPRALIPVARLLGLSVEALRSHTILGAYPWARDWCRRRACRPGAIVLRACVMPHARTAWSNKEHAGASPGCGATGYWRRAPSARSITPC